MFPSKVRFRLALAFMVWGLGVQGARASRRISVVVGPAERSRASILAALREAVDGRWDLSVREVGSKEKNDPIHRGRLLADLHSQDLLVTVGDEATRLLADEIQDTPLYFVGAGALSGAQLADKNVGGILSYNVGQMLDLVVNLWPGALGLVSTPGYEAVEGWIGAGAVERGLKLVPQRVARAKDLPGAIRRLTERTKVIWILGDPLLSRGAGYRFLVEQALSKRVSILSTTSWNVENGALLCLEPSPRGLAEEAGLMMREILDSGLRLPHPRIRESPASGTFLVNDLLARREFLVFPPNLSKRILR